MARQTGAQGKGAMSRTTCWGSAELIAWNQANAARRSRVAWGHTMMASDLDTTAVRVATGGPLETIALTSSIGGRQAPTQSIIPDGF